MYFQDTIVIGFKQHLPYSGHFNKAEYYKNLLKWNMDLIYEPFHHDFV